MTPTPSASPEPSPPSATPRSKAIAAELAESRELVEELRGQFETTSAERAEAGGELDALRGRLAGLEHAQEEIRPAARGARPVAQRPRRRARGCRAPARTAERGRRGDGRRRVTQALPGVGPTLPYAVKSAVTLARSALWLARTRGRPRPRRPADPALPPCGRRRRPARASRRAASASRWRTWPPRATACSTWSRRCDCCAPGHYRRARSALTFDDGFADVAERGAAGARAPRLPRDGLRHHRRHRPACSRSPGTSASRAVLGWDDVVALDRQGTLRFEAHTVVAPEPARGRRRRPPRKRSRRRGTSSRPGSGRPVSAFAYPAGLYGERERRLVAQGGLHRRGLVRAGREPARRRSLRAPPAADRLARPARRLQGQGRRRARLAAAAPRRLPPAALRHGRESSRA